VPTIHIISQKQQVKTHLNSQSGKFPLRDAIGAIGEFCILQVATPARQIKSL
jgi:hypothetical protein